MEYLAVIQIVFGVAALIIQVIGLLSTSKNNDYDMSDKLVDIALAVWCVVGTRNLDMRPVDKFSFAQFILAVKAAVLLPIAFLYYLILGLRTGSWADNLFYAVTGILYYLYSAVYKLYYSYIAWSFCYQILCAKEAGTRF